VPGQWAYYLGIFFFFLGKAFAEIVPLGAYPPRGSTHALDEGAFAGTVPPRANSR
jgi:hypothetical protein